MKKHSIYQKGFGPLIIVIIVAVVAAGGAGTYQVVKKNKAKTAAEADLHVEGEIHATSTQGQLSSGLAGKIASSSIPTNKGTLRALLAMGKDSVCTVHVDTSGTESQGTVYISGTSMRGDFSLRSASTGTIESHMIKEGDMMYMWSNNGQGIKMDASASAAQSGSVQSQTTVNLDTAYGYECKAWRKDVSKFSIPSSVNFVDLNAMINAAGSVKVPLGN